MTVRLRVSRIGLTSPVAPRLRISRIRLTGTPTAQVTVAASAPTVSAFTTITWTATVTQGSPDSYTWAQASGPTTAFTPSGTTCTMVAPADLNGVTVTMGVQGSTDGVPGPVATASVAVLPHLLWRRVAGVWRAIRNPVV